MSLNRVCANIRRTDFVRSIVSKNYSWKSIRYWNRVILKKKWRNSHFPPLLCTNALKFTRYFRIRSWNFACVFYDIPHLEGQITICRSRWSTAAVDINQPLRVAVPDLYGTDPTHGKTCPTAVCSLPHVQTVLPAWGHRKLVVRAIEASYHTQLAKTSFDQILPRSHHSWFFFVFLQFY